MSRLRSLGAAIGVLGLALALWPGILLTAGAQSLTSAETPPMPPVGISQVEYLRAALSSLPLATGLGAALAMRPRRRGTPPRSAAVVQTQIILAVIGALVMLIVGASLARAFGVVGVAGLVRYRAKIADPKDAGVMLATLGVGLACGVGLYALAAFATAFFIGVLWVLESFEPEARKVFELTVKGKDAAKLEPAIKQVLQRHRAKVELRTSAPDELSFELKLPFSQKTDVISKSITDLDPKNTLELEWDEKKNKVPA